MNFTVRLRKLHDKQREIKGSPKKRKIVRAGRRGGKTTLAADVGVEEFLDGHRVLYAVPTADQLDRFWFECKRALAEPLDAEIFYKNESRHIIELPGTEQRIRAKTAWDADSLRGDYADVLILDEWQLMDEDAWERVGAPMLLDNNGDAMFIYTPPSLHSRSRSKARDPRHAAKMFAKALKDERWDAFHFSSHDNPYISAEALDEIVEDMTRLAYEQEILALDKQGDPNALWNLAEMIDPYRVTRHPDLDIVAVAVDPSGGAVEWGIVVGGAAWVRDEWHGYVLADKTAGTEAGQAARDVLTAYHLFKADCIVAEVNFGGDMVRATIKAALEAGEEMPPFIAIHASRGKAIRAEPVAALYQRGRGHHVGAFPLLEDEMCEWVPGYNMPSPNRLDALVWLFTHTIINRRRRRRDAEDVPTHAARGARREIAEEIERREREAQETPKKPKRLPRIVKRIRL